MAAILLLPAASDAAVYKWKHNASGDWNVPGNWERVSGTPCVDQFPNCVNDEAVFPSTLSGIFVDIPANATVTVGAITVYSNSIITIKGKTDDSGRLVLATSTGGPALLRDFGGSGGIALNVTIELWSNLTIMAAPNTSVRLWRVNEVNPRAMTKSGAGKLVFRHQVNHTGGTKIEDGALELEADPGAHAGANATGFGDVATFDAFSIVEFIAAYGQATKSGDGAVPDRTTNLITGEMTLSGSWWNGTATLAGHVPGSPSQTPVPRAGVDGPRRDRPDRDSDS